MVKFNPLVLIFGISLYSGACAKPRPPRDNSWDIIVFNQRWPETACEQYLAKNASNTCRFPDNVNAWSVHGLWPTKLGTKGPSRCNDSEVFDEDKIKSIEKELEQVWVDIHGDSPSPIGFWTYEWSKHGTCALSLDALGTEFKYFDQAIKWMDKYSMADVLQKANIVPSNKTTYSVANIDDAIKKVLGVKPYIDCQQDCTAQRINELRICFDKNLELTDCVPYAPKSDGFVGSLDAPPITDCNTTREVLYPEPSKKIKHQKFLATELI